jgi:hypothetical protein
VAHLHSIGYERRDPVEMVGEYALRGLRSPFRETCQ